ncbi:MAG: RNA polymerase factor sigma-54 [Deltaproteobacteria bacterium]|nr:RNA polymerase factor sigma-54 [Deltaproteobacteria bacterium]
MAMELKLVPKLSQQLVMTPQLKMAIKLLTLNHLELSDAVAQELVENPVLEETYEDTGRPQEGDGDVDAGTQEPTNASDEKVVADNVEVSMDNVGTEQQKDNAQEIDWEAYAEQYSVLPASAGSGADNRFDDMPGYDQTLTREETLEQHFLWAVRMSDFNELEREIAVHLIGAMDDEGFLDFSPVQHPPKPEKKETEAELEHALANSLKETSTDLSLEGEALLQDSILPQDAVAPASSTGMLMDAPGAILGDGPMVGNAALDSYSSMPKSDATAVTLRDGEPSLKSSQEKLLEDSAEKKEALLEDALEPEDVDPLVLIAAELEVPVEWVEKVRQKLQRLEPVGCFSKDLRDCLLVQLDIWGYDNECLVYNIIDKHMAKMERRDFQIIAKTEKVPLKEVGEALKLIEQLEPRPARDYLPGGMSSEFQYITPDVYVTKVAGEYVVSLNEDGLPKLKLSPFYLEKMRAAERGDPSKNYIKDKMRAATWLIRSIHQRQRTIQKVVDSILKVQQDWFEESGPLKPLILREVADDIEMHESTVSRVTTRKYLHCHRGIYELKYFFNSSIASQDGSSIASKSVKEEIKRIVSGENPKKPFSDASIVKQLKELNICIARRTVAKYREVLHILPSSKRKQIF